MRILFQKEKLQIEDTEKEDVKELIESCSNSDNDNDNDNEAPILEPDEVVLEPTPAENHKVQFKTFLFSL